MLKHWYALVIVAALLAAVPAYAGTALAGWDFNVNGTIYENPAPYSGPDPGQLPAAFDASGFDWSTGLGTIIFTYSPGPGNYHVASFFDHDIDVTFYDELGFVNGTAPAGTTWEIDEPGYTVGDIYGHVVAGVLDNTVGLATPDDVSMAMAWDFSLSGSQWAQIAINLSDVSPQGGFYLWQRDATPGELQPAVLAQGNQVFFSGGAQILGSGDTNVPEPSTWLMAGVGLALAGWRMRRRARA